MEHRCARREKTDITVQFTTADGMTHRGKIKNLSGEGACIIPLGTIPEYGSIVDIILPPHQPRLRAKESHVRGFVIRVGRKEVGLIWITEGAIAISVTDRSRYANLSHT